MTSETDFLISRKNLKVSVYLILLRRDEGGGGDVAFENNLEIGVRCAPLEK